MVVIALLNRHLSIFISYFYYKCLCVCLGVCMVVCVGGGYRWGMGGSVII